MKEAIRLFVRVILSLRYRIRIIGLEKISRNERGGILILPNHPALIDPVIMLTMLHGRFAPRALVDKDQLPPRLASVFQRWLGFIFVPDISRHGRESLAQVDAALNECGQALRQGQNLLLYPAGRVYRSRLENIQANTAVERLLQTVPETRVVLARTRGLWGSSFSRASGKRPDFFVNLKEKALQLLWSGIFFGPRRPVTIEFKEAGDFPRTADRSEMNRYLEAFYNEDAPPNTYVPYTLWEKDGIRELPEPEIAGVHGDSSNVPAETRRLVLEHLREVTGRDNVKDSDRLINDFNMDSLTRTELLAWIQSEFGFSQGDAESLQTVSDVLLTACGEGVHISSPPLKPPSAAWRDSEKNPQHIRVPEGRTLMEVFLQQAKQGPGKVVVADQLAGAKTYRDVVTAVLVLKPWIEELEGQYVGIMLPASVTADIVCLATLFSRKTPVMVNWTMGERNLKHSLDLLGVRTVLTSQQLVTKLESSGLSLKSLGERFLPLESLAPRITRTSKLLAFARSYLTWHSLRHAAAADPASTAAVLFTSGSESLPKAVPLSHANILANIRDVVRCISLTSTDSMLGMLPPFHSFGLTVAMLAPLCAGLRVVHHANPTDADVLARLIEAYRVTLVLGTPTFLAGIARAATPSQLRSVRRFVSGAEKCPERTYALLARQCPGATVLEGYGITECSPIVSLNEEKKPVPYSIGRVMPSLEHALLNEENGCRADASQGGMLLVRGPSVFSGYLNYTGASPFVEFEGKTWYRTGDLVKANEDGILLFRGRKKRFVKIGGEMISLPAIEEALEKCYPTESGKGPVLAVEATPDEEHAELVLFTTLDLDRQTVNRQVQEAGLSGLHNLRRVVKMPEIPVLGTGKTDYRALKTLLAPKT